MINLDRFTKGIARALARAKVQSEKQVLADVLSAKPVITADSIDPQDDPSVHSDEQYGQTIIEKMINYIKLRGTK